MDARDQAGGRETVEGGVVVRFPRDWVGPLEELVPFGPSADRENEPDFWGEDSAELQDAVEAAPEIGSRPRIGPRVLVAGAVVAALLLAVAAVLGSMASTAPQVHGVTFAVPSVPPLARARVVTPRRPLQHRKEHPAAAREREPTPQTAAPVTTAGTAPPTTTPSYSSPTAAPSSPPAHQSAAESSSTASSTQSGGAFTLGGP